MNGVNEKEVWKDIEGYEGRYKVSNLGNVYSCYVNRNLKHGKTQDGYPYVMLRKNGKQKIQLIHRLVAIHFIPNPNNLPIINHKDEDKSNYSIDNLEWCDNSYNVTYNDASKKAAKKNGKYVYAYNKDAELVYEYYSAHEAARQLNYSNGCISACCNNNIYTYKNLVWSNTRLSKEEILDRFERRKNNNLKNHWQSTQKAVVKLDLDFNYICEYPSTQEAGRKMNCSASLIGGVCRGEHRQTHGYIFRYKDDYINGIEPVQMRGLSSEPKPVNMYSLNDVFIESFNSLNNAAQYLIDNNLAKGSKTGVAQNISYACKGDYQQAYGFIWEFIN